MIEVIQADLTDPRHQADLLGMLDAYAQDMMGGGEPMADDVKARLIPGLQAHPTAYVFLAYRKDPGDPDSGGTPVGIANCFVGFSTFTAKPLINIHDLAVIPTARRMGVGRKLIDAVAEMAKSLDCCVVTLEVRDDNPAARKLYTDYGFNDGGTPHRFWKLKV
jgi:ribosomal protein S18 acetylase RimI-like enzyme